MSAQGRPVRNGPAHKGSGRGVPMVSLEAIRELSLLREVEILVAGGVTAGAIAGIAGARRGRSMHGEGKSAGRCIRYHQRKGGYTMSSLPASLALLATLLGVSPTSDAAPQATYRHPTLPLQFEAPEGWEPVPHPEDRLIHHMAAPEGGLNVMLWYTETEQEAPRYLQKMADMKGFQPLSEPRQEKLRRQTAWVIRAVNVSEKGDVRAILAALPSEGGLYIVQIWCALERYEEERDRMESILASVEVVS